MINSTLEIINQEFTLEGHKSESANVVFLDWMNDPSAAHQQVNFKLSWTGPDLIIKPGIGRPIFIFTFDAHTLRYEDSGQFCREFAASVTKACNGAVGWVGDFNLESPQYDVFTFSYNGSSPITITGNALDIIVLGIVGGGAAGRIQTCKIEIDKSVGGNQNNDTAFGHIQVLKRPETPDAPMVWKIADTNSLDPATINTATPDSKTRYVHNKQGGLNYLMDDQVNNFTVYFRKSDGGLFNFNSETVIDFIFPAYIGEFDMNWSPSDAFGELSSLLSIECWYDGANQLSCANKAELVDSSATPNPNGRSYGAKKRYTFGFKKGVTGMGVFTFSGLNLSGGNNEAVLHIKVSGLPGYEDANYELKFVKSSFFIAPTGDVGIGTIAPKAKLHVEGGAVFNGLIGIGTIAPQDKLHVKGNAQFEGIMKLKSNPDAVHETDTYGAYFWNEAGVGPTVSGLSFQVITGTKKDHPALFIGQDGSTGIGTTVPKAKLHVEGRIMDQTGYVMPVGSVIAYGGKDIPTGWLICNGNDIPYESEYQKLRNTVGDKTPDLRSRFIVGSGQGDSHYETSLSNYVVNDKGGEEKHTLTVDEMPLHSHDLLETYNWLQQDLGGGSNNRFLTQKNEATLPTNSRGSDKPHNNLPPYYALTYIIKY